MHAMHEMQPIVTNVCGVCPSVRLSCGATLLHCAKKAEQIKMLFGVNTSGGPWNTVLHGGPDPPQTGGGRPTFKCWDPPCIHKTAEARDLKFCVNIDWWEH